MQIIKLSNKQKMLTIALMVVVACVCMLLVQVPQSERGAHLWTSESIPVAQAAKSIPATAVQQPLLAQASLAVAKKSQVPQTSQTEMPSGALQTSWQMGDVKSETPAIRLSEKISEYAIVQLDQNAAEHPSVGQQIQLPMLNGASVVAKVEAANTNPNGDYTWSGHVQGYGTDYPVVMTYGEHSIFATITTPQGSYTMESIDGLGWLYKNPAEIELSNPGAKDFMDVPHE
jgi:cytoskeletal protein RodZ